MTRTLIWLGVAFVISMVVWAYLTHAGVEGLMVFAWAPVYAAWELWRWFARRQTRIRVPSDRELDRELQALLEGEKK